jgi:hypothetical protein
MLSDGEKGGKVNGIMREYFLDVALSPTPPSIKSTLFSGTCMLEAYIICPSEWFVLLLYQPTPNTCWKHTWLYCASLTRKPRSCQALSTN